MRRLRLGLGFGRTQGGANPLAAALSIIQSNGGALFLLEDGDVFQDRSVTPSTAATVGDPVGTIVGRDGTWFAIAPTDGARMTLRQTSDGRRYLEGANNTNRYMVQNAAAGLLSPDGVQFTAVCSGWGLGAASGFLGWGTDSFRNGFGVAHPANTTSAIVYNSSNAAIKLGEYIAGNFNSVYTLRHQNNPTLRVDGSNEYPNKGTGNVKSDLITSFAIGTRDADGQSEGASRLYCMAIIPVILSDADCAAIESALYPYVRQPETPVSTALVDLDLTDSGVLATLTDNLDGSYTYTNTDWTAPGYLISIDFIVPDWSLHTAGQRIMRVERNNTTTLLNREAFFYKSASNNIHYKLSDVNNAFSAGERIFGIGVGTSDVQEGLQRATLWVRPSEVARFQLNGHIWQDSVYRHHWQKNPDGLTVWEDFTSGNVLRLRAKGGTFTEAEANAFHNESDVGLPVHVIGDSFVVFGIGSGVALQQSIISDGYVNITFDGVGGASMAAHASRMDAYPLTIGETRAANVYNSTLVINDGGWDPSETTTADSINTMVALLNGHSRWVYIEPWPADAFPIGNAQRTAFDALQATLASTFGANYIPSFNAVLCAHGEAAADITDASNGIMPDSLTDDGIHPNAASYPILARVIRGALARLGWWDIVTAVPGAPTSFTESSLALSWGMPADDGNDPVRSWTVYVEDSPGAGTFTSVYTGQLRRHTLTGLTTGTWKVRVTATNEVGTGTHAEIDVVVA